MNQTLNIVTGPDYLNLVGYGIVVPVICFLGVICNILNLIVMFDRRLTESCYTYLSCLALADTCALLLFGFNGIGRGHYPNSRPWRMFEAHVYMTVGFIVTTASVIFTVSVTLERFVFLYFPYRSKKWCTQQIARKISLGVTIASFIYNIPRIFVFTVNSEAKLQYTEFGKGTLNSVLSWFHVVVISLCACLLLIVFNILLMFGVKRNSKRRKQLTSSSNRNPHKRQEQDQTRITWMLITVIFVFIIGELPSAMLSRALVVGLYSGGDTTILKQKWYRVAGLIATILVTLQHSLNFAIYCLFHRKFRKIFKDTLCWRKAQIDDNQNSPIRKTDTLGVSNNHVENISMSAQHSQLVDIKV